MKTKKLHLILTLADIGLSSSEIAKITDTYIDKVSYICNKHGFSMTSLREKKIIAKELNIGYPLFIKETA